MKLTISLKTLTAGLKSVLPAVDARHALPVLGNVLVRADAAGLHLSGTNLIIGVTRHIPEATVAEHGATTVPGKLLADTLARYPEVETVTLTMAREDRLQIASDETTATATLKGIDHEEFPALPEVQGRQLSIPVRVLADALSNIRDSAAANEDRPVLASVSLSFGEQFGAAAADGSRLSAQRADIAGAKGTALIPASTVPILLKALDGVEGEVTVTYGSSSGAFIAFETAQARTVVRQIDGQFPDFQRIIPDSAAADRTTVTAEREQLISAFKLAALYAGQQVVLISGVDETLTVQAENAELGDGKSQLRVRTAGAAFKVRMNVQFAISALERMSGAQVQLSACVAGMKPVTFRPMEGSLVHVVMPMSVR
jgi:DNA polymerase-3 subunit beta